MRWDILSMPIIEKEELGKLQCCNTRVRLTPDLQQSALPSSAATVGIGDARLRKLEEMILR